jgi:hypothetical protein
MDLLTTQTVISKRDLLAKWRGLADGLAKQPFSPINIRVCGSLAIKSRQTVSSSSGICSAN